MDPLPTCMAVSFELFFLSDFLLLSLLGGVFRFPIRFVI